MTIRYYTRRGQSVPQYTCQSEGIKRAEPPCQRILGADIDRAIGDLLVESMSPLTLEVALSVQDELAARAEDADRLRRQQVERARYEVELAQRRYLRVDPDNRLVAATLEAEWNNKLRALDEAQEDYARQREADVLFDDEKRQRVLALATDFPRLWRDPATPSRERKRMARLLIEDVTLLKADDLVIHVRFRGGDTRSLRLARPRSALDLHKLDPAVVAEVDRLLDD
ncbi:MAG: recombinase family protein, partial [Candidatus Dormibacteria bacterium]